jgi:hypothetical protein
MARSSWRTSFLRGFDLLRHLFLHFSYLLRDEALRERRGDDRDEADADEHDADGNRAP